MGTRLRYAMRAIVLGTRWLRGLSFWSQSSPFAGVRQHPTGRFVSVNGDVGISPYLGLRIWKAGWVQALAGSNPASSAR
jgi:hypothetical protein